MTTPAFERYAAARWPALVRAAWLLTGDRHEAEDLVQATLARAWRHWRRVAEADEPDAYVRRMLVNEFRRSRLRWRRSEQVGADWHPPAEGPEHAVVLRDTLVRALRELPPRQRLAVTLRYYLDLSEQETAAMMRCSVGTVKSQAARGLARLRELHGVSVDAARGET
ncbi:MAG TPA: SigE family RNA polymerase sigma factor [Mycobacteriales bacterium]